MLQLLEIMKLENAPKSAWTLSERLVFFGWGIVFDMAIWGRFPTFWLLKIFKIKDTLQNKITFGDIVWIECFSSVAVPCRIKPFEKHDQPIIHRWVGGGKRRQDLSKPRVPELSWGAPEESMPSNSHSWDFRFILEVGKLFPPQKKWKATEEGLNSRVCNFLVK